MLETVARPAQRHGAVGAPHLAVDQPRGTAARRLTRADHHGGARAILGEGFHRQRKRHQPAIRQLADTADRVAAHAVMQTGILDGAGIAIGGQPFLDGESVAAAVSTESWPSGPRNAATWPYDIAA